MNISSKLKSRRRLVASSALAMFFPFTARSASLTAKPLTLVVPFPAGGSVDLVARQYADPLAKALGTSVVIDNRAGAGGSIGSAYVARAKPDGYTLVLSSQSSHIANPLIQPNPGYDPIRDFASISQLARTLNVLVVHPSVPAANFAEFIALLKTRPGELNYSSAGAGSMGQLNVELLKMQLHVKATHVPYRGGGQMLTALMANEVQFGIDSLAPFVPFIQSGKLRALAVASPVRSQLLPNVPTFAELGYPLLNETSWIGLAAPAKTPPDIIQVLLQGVRNVSAQPAFVKLLEDSGALPPASQTPAEFTAMMSQRLATYGALVRKAGIRGE